MRTGILSLALALCGCVDEWEDEYGECHEEGDCDFFNRAEWEEIQMLAMLEPLPLPEARFGSEQPHAEAIGRAIFFDDRLGPHGVSCASCHPMDGWLTAPITRREPGSAEFRGITTVIDVVYYPHHKWDASKKTIVELMMGAIDKPSLVDSNAVAVARHVWESPYAGAFSWVSGLERDPRLDTIPQLKMSEWPEDGEYEKVVKPVYEAVGQFLEAYMRTIVSTPSEFDAYVAGDFAALDEAEKRGLELFIGKGHCSACHSGPRFTDDELHNIGLATGAEPDDRALPELGAFRTPSLRNVAMTPPYMHTSEYETLEDVVWHYTDTKEAREGHLDARMWETDLTDAEVWDLVAFLETLTSTSCPWMPGGVCPPPPP
jgi:cytochrome c peroxidase